MISPLIEGAGVVEAAKVPCVDRSSLLVDTDGSCQYMRISIPSGMDHTLTELSQASTLIKENAAFRPLLQERPEVLRDRLVHVS